MDSSLTIEINNSDEPYVEAAVIKARRREAHICLAIQQVTLVLLACLMLSLLVWRFVRNQI